jgi:hypothetical protein
LGKPVIVGASAFATAMPIVAKTASETTTARLNRIMVPPPVAVPTAAQQGRLLRSMAPNDMLGDRRS